MPEYNKKGERGFIQKGEVIMTISGRLQFAGLAFLAGLMVLPAGVSGIESGQYQSDSVSTSSVTIPYYFYAEPQDATIVRLANEDTMHQNDMPDCRIYHVMTIPAESSNTLLVTSIGGHRAIDISLPITNAGWHRIDCSLPASLNWISNSFAFSMSFLRIPYLASSYAPLSVADPDVGPMTSGQKVEGTIDVGADLDAAMFSVSNACRVEFRMGQMSADQVPNVRLYSPSGVALTNDYPPDYRAEITRFVTNSGIYTIGCNDQLNARGSYAVSIVLIPGPIDLSVDPDFGPILNGEVRTGTINHPGDLDVATFAAMLGDTNLLTMTKISADMNPRMELFDPTGQTLLAAPVDLFQTTVSVTNVCTNAGTFYVICKDAADRSAKTYTLTMTTLGGPSTTYIPDIPSTLLASDGAYTNMIMITWGAVTNATGYDLWRSDGTNTAIYLWLVTNTTYTYFQDSNATPNITYSYKVKARNSYGVSAFSTNDSGYCGSVSAVPTGLTASDGTFSNYILVSWQWVTNAVSYDLWRTASTDSTVYVELITNFIGTYYQDSNVTVNLIYNYKVKSRNIVGASDFSSSDSGYCGISGVTSNRRALLVGIDAYGYGPPPLDTCTNDANGMRDIIFLGDPSNRWTSTNITTLLDAAATKTAIRDRLHSMAAQSGSGDLVVYGHSSHGGYAASLSNTYICAYDADYTDTELAADLTVFRPDARIIIIIDACYSGGMYQFDPSGPPPPWPFAERVMAEYQRIQEAQYRQMGLAVPKGLGTNIAFMTACDYDETSQTYGYYSLYWGFLIGGCANSFVDDNGDGEYQFSELHNYASVHAVEINPNQHAQTYNPTLLQTIAARAVGTNTGVSFDLHNDYDGDGVSDLAIYAEAAGIWYIGSVKLQALIGTNIALGGPGYHPITGDYDGDAKADLTVYSESSGTWRIGSLARWVIIAWDAVWGGPGQQPVVGDYNGDGIEDGALYESANGFWYVVTSFGRVLVYGDSFTGSGFTAVPGDYNGDGIADYALYHNEQGYWYILSSAGSNITWGTSWGAAGYLPVSGDYDGDGKSDLAVYNEPSGLWYIWSLARSRALASGIAFGGSGFTPVPGDYNGDRKAELAVYQQATGNWRIRTVDGTQEGLYNFGGPDYIPAKPTW